MSVETRAAAERLIEVIDRNLPRWETWFPNDGAEVDVPRRDLLALKHFAEIGLAMTREDDDEPLDEAFLRSVGGNLCIVGKPNEQGPMREVWMAEFSSPYLTVDEDGDAELGCERIPKSIRTRGEFRKLVEALGIELTAAPSGAVGEGE